MMVMYRTGLFTTQDIEIRHFSAPTGGDGTRCFCRCTGERVSQTICGLHAIVE